MLERDGDEVARATSIVRYAPGSAFSAHSHGAGEEFLVLEGVFSDEHGDFGPGMYVRNPPGSRHTPSSASGCTIFVKLRQMAPDDRAFVRIDTTRTAPGSRARPEASPSCRSTAGPEHVALLRLAPGARLEHHGHPGGEEILVLDGAFEDEQGRYSEGHLAAQSDRQRATRHGLGGRLYALRQDRPSGGRREPRRVVGRLDPPRRGRGTSEGVGSRTGTGRDADFARAAGRRRPWRLHLGRARPAAR